MLKYIPDEIFDLEHIPANMNISIEDKGESLLAVNDNPNQGFPSRVLIYTCVPYDFSHKYISAAGISYSKKGKFHRENGPSCILMKRVLFLTPDMVPAEIHNKISIKVPRIGAFIECSKSLYASNNCVYVNYNNYSQKVQDWWLDPKYGLLGKSKLVVTEMGWYSNGRLNNANGPAKITMNFNPDDTFSPYYLSANPPSPPRADKVYYLNNRYLGSGESGEINWKSKI